MRCNKMICFVFSLFIFTVAAHAQPGLLLIAHGSPSETWNKSVLDLGKKVEELASAKGIFKAVRTAFLEFAKPDIASMVSDLESVGCDRIIAVPLFIAPSGHSHFDVPAVLGIYGSKSVFTTLNKEGASIAKAKVPIMVASTLSEGNILETCLLEQFKKISQDASNEALVILTHGDMDHQGINEQLMKRLVTYCCGKTGINYGDWAFVEMGQEYGRALHVYNNAKAAKKRVLVVGLYLGTSAKTLHERAMNNISKHGPSAPAAEDSSLLFSTEAIIDNPEIARWVVDTATSCFTP